jgi:hypothetical protein
MQDAEQLPASGDLLHVPGIQKQANVTFVCNTALTAILKTKSHMEFKPVPY